MRRLGFWMVVVCGVGLILINKSDSALGPVCALGLFAGIACFLAGLVFDRVRGKDGDEESDPPAA